MNSELMFLTCALQDSLMLLAPSGWTQVDLKTRAKDDAVHLAELSAKGEGAKEPAPKPKLNIELKEEAVRLGEGLAELRHRLEHAGKRWSGEQVRVQRTSAFVEWVLLEADNRPAFSMRLQKEQLDTLLMTDALFEALRGTDPSFETLQTRFETQLKGVRQARYDAASASLLVVGAGGEQTVRAEQVGTYHGEDFAWSWGWAHEDLPTGASERVKRVCAPAFQAPGLSAFWRPSFHCDEGFAWALASHLCVSIGAQGLLRAPDEASQDAVIYAVLA